MHPEQKQIKVRNWGSGVIPPRSHELSSERSQRKLEVLDGEFDPGSGRTLAAGLTHASRTESMELAPEDLVANG